MNFLQAKAEYNYQIMMYNRQRKKQDSDYQYITNDDELANDLASQIIE
jgi:hypothetical protein